MTTHRVDGLKLDEDTYKVVKRMSEAGIGKGRAPRQSVTIAEMCSALVHTGAFRRIAANKWAKEHTPAKGKKSPAKKAAKKASRKAAPKKSAPRKARKAAKKPAPAKAPEAAPVAAPAAPAGDLLS